MGGSSYTIEAISHIFMKRCLMTNEAAFDSTFHRATAALFNTMPAMVFSKDAATGQYLSCNQPFAEYAHKATPQDVVGLTDFQIFDEVTAAHFVEDDKRALAMDEPYVDDEFRNELENVRTFDVLSAFSRAVTKLESAVPLAVRIAFLSAVSDARPSAYSMRATLSAATSSFRNSAVTVSTYVS